MKNNDLDPRTKLVIILILSTLAILYEDLLSLTLILMATIAAALYINRSFISLMIKLKKLIGVMVAIAFVQSLFTRAGVPIISLGSLPLMTDYGIIQAVEFVLRLSIIIISSAIIITSSSREIVQGLIQMKVPYEIAFMVSLSIKLLPIFKDELVDMVTALQLRGVDFKRVGLKEKLKVYRYLFLPIITNSILKARDLSMAMEMKGFRAMPQRTSFKVLKMETKDYLFIFMSLMTAMAFIIIQWEA